MRKLRPGFEGEKLTKHWLSYAVLLSALGAMTFFGVCDPSGRKWGRGGGGSGAAATVGSDSISRVEFQRAYQRTYSQYQRMYQDAFDPSAMHLARAVLSELVDERAMYQKAVDLGLKASDDEITQQLSQMDAFKGEDGKFSEEAFQRVLDSNGFTEASLMEQMRRDITLQKLRRFITETAFVSSKEAELNYRTSETKLDVDYLKFDPQKIDVKISDADVAKFLADAKGKAQVKEYFDANAKEFNTPEQVRARHILVSYKGARNATAEATKRDKAAAKTLAEQLLAKAKAPGADFAALAKANTDEPAGKTTGGDLGWFSRETMDKAFSDAAFKLKAGELSGVVETPFGFHVIKVEDHKQAVSTKLADVEKKIAEQLLAKEKRPEIAKERATKVLEALKAKQPDAELLKADGVAWASTGEVGADARYLPGIGSSKEVSDALASLAAPGQLYPSPLDVRGNLFILRLKSRKEPDMSKLDKDKKRELATTASYTEGNSLYTAYEKQVKEDLDKQQKVWMNPDFLALDDKKEKTDSGS